MTRVLVTGGSGVLGRSLLSRPAAKGFAVRTMSRGRPAELPEGVEWVRADLGTGEGLDQAVAGVDVILHAASSARKDTRRIDVDGTRLLIEAAKRAGVRHLVFVSIVGIDRIPFPYYRLKVEVEGVVKAGGVPWTILRATQFHEFVEGMLWTMARLPIALVPKGWKNQPVHVDDVADRLWTIAAGEPGMRTLNIAGPRVLTFGEMARSWLAARGSRKPVLNLWLPTAWSAAFHRGELTLPSAAHPGGTTWEEWLERRYGGVPAPEKAAMKPVYAGGK